MNQLLLIERIDKRISDLEDIKHDFDRQGNFIGSMQIDFQISELENIKRIIVKRQVLACELVIILFKELEELYEKIA